MNELPLTFKYAIIKMSLPVGKGKLKDALEVGNTYLCSNPVSCKAKKVLEQETLGQELPEFTPLEMPQVIVERGSHLNSFGGSSHITFRYNLSNFLKAIILPE